MPFAEWVIDGDFPAGRPNWESAGVTFSSDIHSHERRKLWLLNGSHSLLAYVGLVRGCETVAEAMCDSYCAETAQLWWNDALTVLDGDEASLRSYTEALRARFANPRIQYQLAQIGTDGSLKIPVRWIPGLQMLREAGVMPVAIVRGLAAYTLYLHGDDIRDARRDALIGAVAHTPSATFRAVLELLAPALLDDAELLAAVDAQLEAFAA